MNEKRNDPRQIALSNKDNRTTPSAIARSRRTLRSRTRRDVPDVDLPDAEAVEEIIRESERIIREAPPEDASNSILQYLHDIQRYPLLKPDQEYRLAVLARAGNREAQEALVNHNLRFVITVARKHLTSGMSLEDLIQEGNLGLLKAVTKFNPDRGVRFVSYAVYWINQSMRQGLAGQQRAVRLPVNRATQLAKIRRVIAEYERRDQRRPTAQEIAAETSIPISMVKTLLRVAQAELSFDAPHANDNESTLSLAEKIGIDSDLDLMIEKQCRDAKIEAALKQLRPRDAQVLRLCFGLDGRELTLEEIGKLLGITRERVRQIRDRALRDLRTKGYANALRDYATSHYPEK